MKRPLGLSWLWLGWILLTLFFWWAWNFLASRNPTYAAERLLWPAQIAAERISKDPDSAPAAQVEKILLKLRQVIQRYPGSNSAARAQLLIGGIHATRKEYAAAHEAFQRVLSDYPTRSIHVITAYRVIARTYMNQKAWGKVLETYRTML